MYSISTWLIYELIKHEPSFPVRNVGLKKKYLICIEEFEDWMSQRRRTALKPVILSGDQLLKKAATLTSTPSKQRN